jgi:nucleoid-associated protein YgaU
MTRDTKIGLLLGLVFIFIIAFLINGLPRLKGRSQAASQSKLARTPLVSSPGLGANARTIAGQAMPGPLAQSSGIMPATQLQTDGTAIRSITPLPATGGQQVGQPNLSAGLADASVRVAGGASTPTPGQPLVNPASTSAPATAGSPSQVGGLTTVANNTMVPMKSLATSSAPQQSTGPAGALAPDQSTLPSPSGISATVQNPGASSQGVQPAVKTASSEWPKPYKVVKGDSLEVIAKRMYGPAEGAKRSSIKRIFEANKAILSSPEQLSVDQQLTIPAPAGSSSGPAPAVATNSTHSSSTPAKSTSTTPAKPAVATKTETSTQGQRYYTVKEGDSLWRIATSQLGKGTRYQEILKLNSDTLKNSESNLEQGMKLRLPAK